MTQPTPIDQEPTWALLNEAHMWRDGADGFSYSQASCDRWDAVEKELERRAKEKRQS